VLEQKTEAKIAEIDDESTKIEAWVASLKQNKYQPSL
jgi:hypothetical protein